MLTGLSESYRGKAVVITALALVGVLGSLAAFRFVSGQAATSAQAAQATEATPHIPAKIECAMLVQDGATRNPAVPDFQEIPGAPARVTSARVVAATENQPEYCEVNGYVQPQIKFQLKLPTKTWHGRYLQLGCGGYCGSIPRTAFPATRSALGGDFALAATNNGHDSIGVDTLWAGLDEQARIDYGHRAVHVVAVAARAIIAAYYGRPPARSYWTGCSAGGREGLMEAQRYPRDFDGIIAGAPASLQTFNPLYIAWGLRANTDASGNPVLTTEKLAPLHAAVVKACDSNDGVVGDGLIGDPRDCNFDPASIQCPGGDAPDCLSPAQVRVVRTLYSGNYDAQGRLLEPRVLPRGSEMSWAGFWTPRPGPASAASSWIRNTGAWPFGDNAARWFSFPIGQGKPLEAVQLTVQEFQRMASSAKYYEPLNPDLREFRKVGGKLLIYHGFSDGLTPPSQTLIYYNAVRRMMGGQEETDRFVRLFMIPGFGHCSGGLAPDTSELLLQMVRWVEGGTAPERILAADRNPDAQMIRQRPVFRYPFVARYTGPHPSQDPAGPNRPESYVAELPAKLLRDSMDWVGNFLLAPPGAGATRATAQTKRR